MIATIKINTTNTWNNYGSSQWIAPFCKPYGYQQLNLASIEGWCRRYVREIVMLFFNYFLLYYKRAFTPFPCLLVCFLFLQAVTVTERRRKKKSEENSAPCIDGRYRRYMREIVVLISYYFLVYIYYKKNSYPLLLFACLFLIFVGSNSDGEKKKK